MIPHTMKKPFLAALIAFALLASASTARWWVPWMVSSFGAMGSPPRNPATIVQIAFLVAALILYRMRRKFLRPESAATTRAPEPKPKILNRVQRTVTREEESPVVAEKKAVIDSQRKFLADARRTGDPHGIIEALRNLGDAYEALGMHT